MSLQDVSSVPLRSLFVYGTLKPGQCNYERYCGDRVQAILPAMVRGRLYQLCLGYPALTCGTEWVKGYLLELADESVLDALDALEDYHPDRPEDDNEYLRQATAVFDRQGRSLGMAWAYWMTPQRIQQYQGQWLAHGEWSADL